LKYKQEGLIQNFSFLKQIQDKYIPFQEKRKRNLHFYPSVQGSGNEPEVRRQVPQSVIAKI
jgi:hypothetical protein